MARRPARGARTAVVPLRARRPGLLARLAPSGRSVALGLALLLGATGAFLVARETSLFAVRTIEVEGASPALAAEVRRALAPLLGTSLLRVRGDEVQRDAGALPAVASVAYDRAFPHTLRVRVRPEVPVAVVRQGAEAWLASARGRIVRALERPARSRLPRIWVGRTVSVSVGATLGGDPAAAASVLGTLRRARLPAPVRSVRAGTDELTLVLRSGGEIRLGDGSDLRLKLAIARRILRSDGVPAGYLDVSVPERPVAGQKSQVGG